MRTVIQILSLSLILFFNAQQIAEAAEAAGKVIASTGDFYTLKDHRPLTRRAVFYQGDVLVTGKNSNAQVLFSDGSIVSLPADSQFRIDNYSFKGQKDTKGKYVVTLLKGGFKTITGVIGKNNPDAYQAKTHYATIGIRGTFFVLYETKDNLDISFIQGWGSLTTPDGEVMNLGKNQQFNNATIGRDRRIQGLKNVPLRLQRIFGNHLQTLQNNNRMGSQLTSKNGNKPNTQGCGACHAGTTTSKTNAFHTTTSNNLIDNPNSISSKPINQLTPLIGRPPGSTGSCTICFVNDCIRVC